MGHSLAPSPVPLGTQTNSCFFQPINANFLKLVPPERQYVPIRKMKPLPFSGEVSFL